MLEEYCGLKLLVVSPLPSRPHYVARHPPLEEIVQELETALSPLPRPDDVPTHWRPMHGDFAPWNLRSFGREGMFLVDWEEAQWAPPRGDEVFYRAAAAALGLGAPPLLQFDEAIDFWQRMILARASKK
jgi:hypothetical protein